jgi:hypothetical protein
MRRISTATESPESPSRGRLPQWFVPVGLLLVFVALVATILFLAQRASQPDAPPKPGPFQGPVPVEPVAPFDVETANAGALGLQSGASAQAVQVTLAPSIPVEFLEPAAPSTIVPGEVVTVIGIPNEVKSFSIRLVVVFPPDAPFDGDGIARSPSGFAGHESERDQDERPILSGTVASISGKTLTLFTPSGPMTLDLEATAPLRRLETGTGMDVQPADRLAVHTVDGQLEWSRGVLVLVQGAR